MKETGRGRAGPRRAGGAIVVAGAMLAASGCAPRAATDGSGTGGELVLHARHHVPAEAREAGEQPVVEETLRWDPERTALVIVDMWDDHWCRGAARRVAELAPAVDRFARAARERGVLVVHCPSTTVEPYEGTPARERVRRAPPAEPPAPLSDETRWGTGWCWLDPEREGELPIDDSDMGCACPEECAVRDAWSRQIDLIAIDDRDALTDDGQELWNLFAQRGIENVMVCGVHLNMCVLGRPFGIRQLVRWERDVVLVRDLTDTMYDPRQPPHVDHFTGTDLVVEHVETHWCPSIESVDLVGGEPFRFAEDTRRRGAAAATTGSR